MGAQRVLVVGLGNMGLSHALAYSRIDGYEIAGLCTRNIDTMQLPAALQDTALHRFRRGSRGHEAGCGVHQHLVRHACAVCDPRHGSRRACLCRKAARRYGKRMRSAWSRRPSGTGRKLVIGYIRHHPSWIKFIEIARTLGTPHVFRMNLNQQSSGAAWEAHKRLLQSLSPIVDCGVHYVDVMCQITKANPVQVHGSASPKTCRPACTITAIST